MKKLKLAWICLLFLFMTACSNEFARQEYDSDEKIAQAEDHYAKQYSVSRSTNEGYSLTIGKVDGRQSLWEEKFETDRTLEMDFSFSLAKGLAKIVQIDEDGNVTTVIECSPDTSTDGFVTRTVSFKSGQNRLKIVGYDCEDIDLKIRFPQSE